jgi:hypothetical protein
MPAYQVLSRRTPRSAWVARGFYSIGDTAAAARSDAVKIAESHANLGDHADIVLLRGNDPDRVGHAGELLNGKRCKPADLLGRYPWVSVIEWVGPDLTDL